MSDTTYCPECGERTDRYPHQNIHTCRDGDCGWDGTPVTIKPCPFCGGEAELSMTQGADFIVTCRGCGAMNHDDMKWEERGYSAIANVAEKWNKRAA